MRTCKVCNEEKELEEFPKNGKFYKHQCKLCCSSQAKARYQGTDGGATRRAKSRKKYAELPLEERQEKHAKQMRRPGQRERKNAQSAAAALLRTHGITVGERACMLSQQQDMCPICRQTTPGKLKFWNTDHNHSIATPRDAVRGVLCGADNLAIGGFKDDPGVCLRAAEYIEEHAARLRAADVLMPGWRRWPNRKFEGIYEVWSYKIWNIYGTTPSEYEAMKLMQGGKCCLCNAEDRRLDWDHAHLDGYENFAPEAKRKCFRGFLCHLCNKALGLVQDDPARLRRMASYLDLWKFVHDHPFRDGERDFLGVAA